MDRPPTLLLPAVPTKLLPLRESKVRTSEDFSSDLPLPNVPGYEIVGLLGEGGMGVVYKARDLALKRFVAIKMIAAKHLQASMRQRFQTEAETFARLQHPNFVQIYEVNQFEGRPYLVLELVEGGTLSGHIARDPLRVHDAARLVATLAHAMHHAHQRGVVHRDLKPSNILLPVSDAGYAEPNRTFSPLPLITLHPKISDFGLAKLLDLENGQTCSGIILGTPAYMAPEQAAGRTNAIGPATDIYALGAILYECLTGRPPFFGENAWDVMAQVMHDDPEPPSRWQPRLARDLDTICLKALAKDPAQRYDSAEALAADLDHFVAGEAIAARPENSRRKLVRRLRKRPMTVAAVLLAIGTTLMAGQFWLARMSDSKDDLTRGRELVKNHSPAGAEAHFAHGLDRLRHIPGATALESELRRELRAVQLRILADQIRFRFDPKELDVQERDRLADQCRQIWESKDLLLKRGSGDADWENRVSNDFLDIALIGLELDTQMADAEAAFGRLDELERLFGNSAAIVYERHVRLHRLSRSGAADQLPIPTPQTAADFQRLGRAFRNAGKLDEAAIEFARGLEREPSAYFLYIDQAKCAMDRKRFDDAISALTACIALEPNVGVCYSRRAAAYWERAKTYPADAAADRSKAFADLRLAILRDPKLGEAWYNQGFFHAQQHDLATAAHDIRLAVDHGYPAAKGYFNLAVIQWQVEDREGAKASLQRVLQADPNHTEAKALLKQWER